MLEKMLDIQEQCPLCGGTKEMIKRPARLMGATYPEDDQWKGDEHLEPCPICVRLAIEEVKK